MSLFEIRVPGSTNIHEQLHKKHITNKLQMRTLYIFFQRALLHWFSHMPRTQKNKKIYISQLDLGIDLI